ncbi:TSL-kinase interacting protein 1 [Elaeis guineensis]|uniref:TSL-kinase interacting protein 1 n=1 Tax=Elaeis guineensis var. tenera TaxID=51953 RepID=A0A6I9RAU3_ELAGV|nr:TSL-kinase interacting protein 1 [Elaeis guineensis]XP_019705927.1 TSL-kinase interacting protein 1 [Elaeis guineensis]XP_019705942.1 TSL-kinase interacting protein 1 [Elaeis guineensis]XP_019705958.1 TSL-kinase interacting protein 1 [Elaeis guineensis]XP_019705966.1 TSL-kinase interacting protein 1 [Elaeis guineensis]XP_019705975.1 TSL-kinase interacting protein 1 [Elaeis guineensis]XP_019705993.1 TSL-kinase interacting protein 1 [Elaeis guineensis]XP_029121969.1 TSL-kinase interacting p
MKISTPMGSQVDMELRTPLAEHVLMKEADFAFPSSSPMTVATQKPAKKPTRQWAAWTRQEEENFFNALRQVGKNFEKITCRVQSKNKDQVRHYYYRLVRRMNKLLGPGFYLDAKNSKDTNAAMLRWWSLLEKYSCTASKLHLKPRRFKIFVEALENQLLKDRNKTKRRRPHGDIYSSTPSTQVVSRAPGNDARSLKLLTVDAQTTNKVGATKGASFKRNVNANMNFSKGDSSMKTAKQKRRTGVVASAEYRSWEEAAMAGVSLVADAAEQLERAANERNGFSDGGTCNMLPKEMYNSNNEICSHQIKETIMQPHVKLKLQLFPIDEGTRKALEKDAHNPHLELTLSARKKISSVLDHLNRKWGNSSIASGELMLFPYNVQLVELASCRRWTIKDTAASAADVYATIGSPAVFRLRYGWFSSAELRSGTFHVPSPDIQSENCMLSKGILNGNNIMNGPDAKCINADAPPITEFVGQPQQLSEDQQTSVIALATSNIDPPEPMNEVNCVEPMDELPENSGRSPFSTSGEETKDLSGGPQQEDEVNAGMKCVILSAGEWADSLTNISVGDLLSEASKAAKDGCLNSPAGASVSCLQQIQFSCDSFDAAIAAHISGHQLLPPTMQASHASIWNAEETCDEFSFPAMQQDGSKPSTNSSVEACREITYPSSLGFQDYLKELAESRPADDPSQECLTAEPESDKDLSFDDRDNPQKDPCLQDIYWPDSLGPLDLDIPSPRYHGQDLGFGDSLSGLSRLIASSLDAFQNCSFFSLEKESSATGACGASFLLDDKVPGE